MRKTLISLLALSAIVASQLVASPATASVPDKPFTRTQCENYSDSVARLYTAGLGREPEQGGFDFWITEYTLGNWTFPRMAQFFVESPEFQESYGTLTQDQFIRQLYRNVLGREGEAGGITFWNEQMTAGMTRATVLMRFAESPENITNSGTAEPALGPFNEGRGDGAWRCGPSIADTMLRLSDFPASWSVALSSDASPSLNECESALFFASTEIESVQFSGGPTNSPYFAQVIYLAPTHYGAKLYLDQTRQFIADCATHETSGSLNAEIVELNLPRFGDDSVALRTTYRTFDGTLILELDRVTIQDGPVATTMVYLDVDGANAAEAERLAFLVESRIAALPYE